MNYNMEMIEGLAQQFAQMIKVGVIAHQKARWEEIPH